MPKLAIKLSPDGSGEFIFDEAEMPMDIMQSITEEMEKLGMVVEHEGAVDGVKSAVNPMWLCG